MLDFDTLIANNEETNIADLSLKRYIGLNYFVQLSITRSEKIFIYK